MNKPELDGTRTVKTRSGIYIDVFEPKITDFSIEDIAHSLSLQCRFNGHTQEFYSVAEHCLRASTYFKLPQDKLEALLHDAAEAYIGDLPKPIKDELSCYKEIEKTLDQIIADRFNLRYPMSKQLKVVDRLMLEWEWENIVIDNKIEPLPPREAKNRFIKLYYKLIEKVDNPNVLMQEDYFNSRKFEYNKTT